MTINKRISTTILCMCVMTSPCAMAEDLDEASSKALNQTMELLTDNEAREKAAQESPEGRAASERVKALAGSEEDTQRIYELASDVFQKMTRESKGDGDKMQEMLQQDPEDFLKRFTPEQRRQLRSIANSIKSKQAPMPK